MSSFLRLIPRCSSALFVTALVLAGCTGDPVPPCPEIRVDTNTSRLTAFKEGEGRDVTDVAYDAAIVSYAGSCNFGDEGVEVDLDVDFLISNGPSVTPGPLTLYYFVAIPRFYPDAKGKQVFTLQRRLQGQPGRSTRFTEEGIRVFIPLDDKLMASGYDVYVGFQLTDEQLQYNRDRRR